MRNLVNHPVNANEAFPSPGWTALKLRLLLLAAALLAMQQPVLADGAAVALTGFTPVGNTGVATNMEQGATIWLGQQASALRFVLPVKDDGDFFQSLARASRIIKNEGGSIQTVYVCGHGGHTAPGIQLLQGSIQALHVNLHWLRGVYYWKKIDAISAFRTQELRDALSLSGKGVTSEAAKIAEHEKNMADYRAGRTYFENIETIRSAIGEQPVLHVFSCYQGYTAEHRKFVEDLASALFGKRSGMVIASRTATMPANASEVWEMRSVSGFTDLIGTWTSKRGVNWFSDNWVSLPVDAAGPASPLYVLFEPDVLFARAGETVALAPKSVSSFEDSGKIFYNWGTAGTDWSFDTTKNVAADPREMVSERSVRVRDSENREGRGYVLVVTWPEVSLYGPDTATTDELAEFKIGLRGDERHVPEFRKRIAAVWSVDNKEVKQPADDPLLFKFTEPGSRTVKARLSAEVLGQIRILGEASRQIVVGASAAMMDLRIEGPERGEIGRPVTLAAVVKGIDAAALKGILCTWKADGPGKFEPAQGLQTQFTPATSGTYRVTIEVTVEEAGKIRKLGEAYHVVTVEDAVPPGPLQKALTLKGPSRLRVNEEGAIVLEETAPLPIPPQLSWNIDFPKLWKAEGARVETRMYGTEARVSAPSAGERTVTCEVRDKSGRPLARLYHPLCFYDPKIVVPKGPLTGTDIYTATLEIDPCLEPVTDIQWNGLIIGDGAGQRSVQCQTSAEQAGFPYAVIETAGLKPITVGAPEINFIPVEVQMPGAPAKLDGGMGDSSFSYQIGKEPSSWMLAGCSASASLSFMSNDDAKSLDTAGGMEMKGLERKSWSSSGFTGTLGVRKEAAWQPSGGLPPGQDVTMPSYARGGVICAVKGRALLTVSFSAYASSKTWVPLGGNHHSVCRAATEALFSKILAVASGTRLVPVGTPSVIGSFKLPDLSLATNAPGPLSVSIQASSLKVSPPGSVDLTAAPQGGTAPYQFAWSLSGNGSVQGVEDKAKAQFEKIGPATVTVTVTDSTGKSATAGLTIVAGNVRIALVRTRPASGPLHLGSQAGFKADVSEGAELLPKNALYGWTPHPMLFNEAMTETADVLIRCERVGTTKASVDVVEAEGAAYRKIAESEELDVEVVGPRLSLEADDLNPYVGDVVTVTVADDPKVPDDLMSFWWEYSGNVLNPGPLKDERVYTFRTKDLNKVTVTVHAKADQGGDDLGQQSVTVQAKPYTVTISEPKPIGRAPQVRDPKTGSLVDVPRAVAVDQRAEVSVTVAPPPEGELRYAWSVTPEDGISRFSLPPGKEGTISSSQAGSYTLSVTVRGKDDVVLGTGTLAFTVVGGEKGPGGGKPGTDEARKQQLRDGWKRQYDKAKEQYENGDFDDAAKTLAPVQSELQQNPGVAPPALASQIEDLSKKVQNRRKAEKLWKDGTGYLTADFDMPNDAEKSYEQSLAIHPDAKRQETLNGLKTANQSWAEAKKRYDAWQAGEKGDAVEPVERILAMAKASVGLVPSAKRQTFVSQLEDFVARKRTANEIWTQARDLYQGGNLKEAEGKCRESLRNDPAPSGARKTFLDNLNKANMLWEQGRECVSQKRIRDALNKCKESVGLAASQPRLDFVAQLEKQLTGGGVSPEGKPGTGSGQAASTTVPKPAGQTPAPPQPPAPPTSSTPTGGDTDSAHAPGSGSASPGGAGGWVLVEVVDWPPAQRVLIAGTGNYWKQTFDYARRNMSFSEVGQRGEALTVKMTWNEPPANFKPDEPVTLSLSQDVTAEKKANGVPLHACFDVPGIKPGSATAGRQYLVGPTQNDWPVGPGLTTRNCSGTLTKMTPGTKRSLYVSTTYMRTEYVYEFRESGAVPPVHGGGSPGANQGATTSQGSSDDILGLWQVLAHQSSGSLSFSKSGGVLAGAILDTPVRDISFDPATGTLKFVRYAGTSIEQRYTGVLRNGVIEGTFDQGGSGSYKWKAWRTGGETTSKTPAVSAQMLKYVGEFAGKLASDYGKVVFELLPDGDHIKGTWGYGDSSTGGGWSGTRVKDAPPSVRPQS